MARQKSEFMLRCEAAGLNHQTVRYRMRKGMSLNEALSVQSLASGRQEVVYDRNRPQLDQADMSWQAVRSCIKSLEHQVRMFERIIAGIKEDPEGRKAYERAMKKIVEDKQ